MNYIQAYVAMLEGACAQRTNENGDKMDLYRVRNGKVEIYIQGKTAMKEWASTWLGGTIIFNQGEVESTTWEIVPDPELEKTDVIEFNFYIFKDPVTRRVLDTKWFSRDMSPSSGWIRTDQSMAVKPI